MNKLYIFLLLTFCLSCTNLTNKITEPEKKNNLRKIYPLALRGELTEVFSVLDTLDTIRLSTKEKC